MAGGYEEEWNLLLPKRIKKRMALKTKNKKNAFRIIIHAKKKKLYDCKWEKGKRKNQVCFMPYQTFQARPRPRPRPPVKPKKASNSTASLEGMISLPG